MRELHYILYTVGGRDFNTLPDADKYSERTSNDIIEMREYFNGDKVYRNLRTGETVEF